MNIVYSYTNKHSVWSEFGSVFSSVSDRYLKIGLLAYCPVCLSWFLFSRNCQTIEFAIAQHDGQLFGTP